jgi:hypothetical protein
MNTYCLVSSAGFIGIGLFELLVLFVLSGGALVVAGVIVWLVVRSSRRRTTTLLPAHGDRLRELYALRAQSLITAEEYEQRRRRILDEI